MCLPTRAELRVIRGLPPRGFLAPVELLRADRSLLKGSVYTLLRRLLAKDLVFTKNHKYHLTEKGLAVRRACR